MGFFNRKKKDKASDISKLASGLQSTADAEIAKQQVAQIFKTPETYTGNRELYDSGIAKRMVKQESFDTANANNSKVVDPYTNKELRLRKIEAKNDFGSEWTEHLAEGDHITPIERVFKDNHDNPWIKNEDIRDIANSEDNLQTVSRKFNNAKRSRTNEELVTDEEYLKKTGLELSEEGKAKAIETGRKSKQIIDKKMKTTAFKNAVKTGHKVGLHGAKQAGITAATISSIINIVDVIKGKKEPKDALIDTAKDTGKAAATGYLMTGGLTTISHTLSNSSSKFIQGLAKSNIPGYIITAVMTTGDTISRYAKGEISTQDCIIELGEKGLNFATAPYSMAAGQALIPIPVVGAAVGLLVGSLLTSSLYNKVIDDLKNKKLQHDERLRLINEAQQLRDQEKQYRLELEKYLKEYLKDFADCFDEALNSIEECFKSGDADGVIQGANKITKKLNGTVQYDSVNSFKNFLNTDTVDIL